MRVPYGFTLIEIVIALLIGSILTSIALTSYGSARGRFAVRGAVNTFSAVHARARAAAIERGTTTRLRIFPDGDSVTVVRGVTTVESINFRATQRVDIRAASNITLCMTPRGFANDVCNSFSSPVTVTFASGADASSVQILPLGQLVF